MKGESRKVEGEVEGEGEGEPSKPRVNDSSTTVNLARRKGTLIGGRVGDGMMMRRRRVLEVQSRFTKKTRKWTAGGMISSKGNR